MDKPISVGDLVYITKPLECGHGATGKVFVVAGIRISTPVPMCATCGVPYPQCMVAEIHGRLETVPIARLRRIPPLDEMDDVKRDEEITA